MSGVLLEARPFRPFKSSEEYLYAMKEDLAEWFQTMYPPLNISAENFMEKLETGVTLCEHANAVKIQAAEYVKKKKAKQYMNRSVTSSIIQAKIIKDFTDVKYFSPAYARPGSFYARDNVSNFIVWCRSCMEIMDCLLFETDDLIMRKNEKHVILCLLEVARRGAKYGMLAPMLVQMERQIDREIAADQRKLGVGEGFQEQEDLDEDTDSDLDQEDTVLVYGPVPQIVTNDLKSLDEMVRDLVEKCTCPTQFPMIRVSEGKYRIGDTKVLIFVRILRSHVMVRVGGGWDTLSHYLDKHDPCRCRSQHRATQGARLVNRPGAADLHGSQVHYDRSATPGVVHGANGTIYSPSSTLGPPMNSLNRSRSRSPSHLIDRRSVSPNLPRKTLAAPQHNRSRSPTPNFTSTYLARLSNKGSGKSPQVSPQHQAKKGAVKGESLKTEATLQVNDSLTDHSDTTSEMSDEGYRSLGVQDKNKKRSSVYSQNSVEDVDENEHQLSDHEEINEMGLRKTSFSQKIYQTDDHKPTEIKSNDTTITKPTQKIKDSPVSSPEHKTHKISVQPKKSMDKTGTGTWNGRSKSARLSLTPESFQSPFIRNAPKRRSVATVGTTRRSSSASTSPIKRNLRDELLKTVEHVNDDAMLVQEVKDLLRKFGSLEQLHSEDMPSSVFSRKVDERCSIRSPRRDVRTNSISRIPAPILLHKA